jgi:hypothetical protein
VESLVFTTTTTHLLLLTPHFRVSKPLDGKTFVLEKKITDALGDSCWLPVQSYDYSEYRRALEEILEAVSK